MSIEETPENTLDYPNKLGYNLFRKGAVRRFNPSLFAVRREDDKGWFLVELKEGKWNCDCRVNDETDGYCEHVYAALLSSATDAVQSEEPYETAEEKTMKCRYCSSPDISRVGFRYNVHGISRRYLCNQCYRKFSIPYIEPQASLGAPSGTLWLLNQIAMLTSKLTDLLKDLDQRIMTAKGPSLQSSETADANGIHI
jgi:transposase-like protein